MEKAYRRYSIWSEVGPEKDGPGKNGWTEGELSREKELGEAWERRNTDLENIDQILGSHNKAT